MSISSPSAAPFSRIFRTQPLKASCGYFHCGISCCLGCWNCCHCHYRQFDLAAIAIVVVAAAEFLTISCPAISATDIAATAAIFCQLTWPQNHCSCCHIHHLSASVISVFLLTPPPPPLLLLLLPLLLPLFLLLLLLFLLLLPSCPYAKSVKNYSWKLSIERWLQKEMIRFHSLVVLPSTEYSTE